MPWLRELDGLDGLIDANQKLSSAVEIRTSDCRMARTLATPPVGVRMNGALYDPSLRKLTAFTTLILRSAASTSVRLGLETWFL